METAAQGFGACSSNTSVGTPDDFYRLLDAEFQFDHDPCPLNSPHDGLAAEHPWGASNFVNPPFNACHRWLERAAREAEQNGATSVCLVPLRPNTIYWERWVLPVAHQIRVLTRRLSFRGYEGRRAPMAMCLVVYAPHKRRRGSVKVLRRGHYSFYRVRL